MAAPTGVSIAFGDAALEVSPDWTDLLDVDGVHVTGWTISRGRQSEFDKTGTGTASVTITDTGGNLDPTNPSSIFYGNLDPMKQAAICLRSPISPYSWSTLFRGFVSEWMYELDETERIAYVTLQLVDAFGFLSRLQLTPGLHGTLPIPAGMDGDVYYPDDQQFDDRIVQALDDAGWPGTGTTGTGLRRIFSGNVALQEKVYARRDSLLSVLMDAADAEFPGVSNIFSDKDGKVTAHGRLARFSPGDYTTNGILSWKAGDLAAAALDSGVVPISGLNYRRSEDDIRNAVIALPKDVDETDVPDSFVSDGDSIAAYGMCSDSFTDLLTLHGDEGPDLTAVDETKLFADYYVDNYKLPRTRVTTIKIRPRPPSSVNGTALWALMCGVDISHVVALTTTHQWPDGFTGGFGESFFVEGIRYEAKPLGLDSEPGRFPEVTLELDVSPTAYYTTNPFA